MGLGGEVVDLIFPEERTKPKYRNNTLPLFTQDSTNPEIVHQLQPSKDHLGR